MKKVRKNTTIGLVVEIFHNHVQQPYITTDDTFYLQGDLLVKSIIWSRVYKKGKSYPNGLVFTNLKGIRPLLKKINKLPMNEAGYPVFSLEVFKEAISLHKENHGNIDYGKIEKEVYLFVNTL